MPYRPAVLSAVEALFRHQNSDGGFPATMPGQDSGCWTSADVLMAALSAGSPARLREGALRDCVLFLLSSEVITEVGNGKRIGGWPLFQSEVLCTMATGHVVAALVLASRFWAGHKIEADIKSAIDRGFAWLEHHQARPAGTWSPYPAAEAGAEARLVSTSYACMPYFYAGIDPERNATYRRALNAVASAQKESGGWSNRTGGTENVTDTARAVLVLARANLAAHQSIVQKGADYILSNWKGKDAHWDIDVERIFEPGAAAQLVLNRNTPCDVLLALSLARPRDPRVLALAQWLLSSQEDSGLWPLASPSRTVDDITTWSTAEWIMALEHGFAAIQAQEPYIGRVPAKHLIPILVVIVMLLLVLVVSMTGLDKVLGTWWAKLSDGAKSVIVIGIGLALAVNLSSSVMYDLIKQAKLPSLGRKQ